MSSKALIMVIDDEGINLKIISELLFKDYELTLFSSGSEAVEYLAMHPLPNLILLDVIMDGINGLEVCRMLKKDPRTTNIPIIFLTSLDDDYLEEEGFTCGAVDYVKKPLSPATLKARIKTHLKLESTLKSLSCINETLEQRVKEEIEKNRYQEQLMTQQSKMAAMGEMIGAIAHQWRQPLNALALLVQNVEDAYKMKTLDESYMERFVQRCMKHMEFMSSTIDDFRNFFKPSKTKTSFDLLDSICEVIKLYSGQFKQHNIDMILHCHLHCYDSCRHANLVTFEKKCTNNEFMYYGYENEFKQVLLNIINNAKDEIINKKITHGIITFSLKKEPTSFIIEIQDNAGGIPLEYLDKIFEPYFTTKGVQGTGIGLYMSKTIIENSMNGELRVENKEEGARFTMKFHNDFIK